MICADACPIISDRDVILGFVDRRRGPKYHAAIESMQRLLDGKADEVDRDRLVSFIDRCATMYPITTDALGRVLNGG